MEASGIYTCLSPTILVYLQQTQPSADPGYLPVNCNCHTLVAKSFTFASWIIWLHNVSCMTYTVQFMPKFFCLQDSQMMPGSTRSGASAIEMSSSLNTAIAEPSACQGSELFKTGRNTAWRSSSCEFCKGGHHETLAAQQRRLAIFQKLTTPEQSFYWRPNIRHTNYWISLEHEQSPKYIWKRVWNFCSAPLLCSSTLSVSILTWRPQQPMFLA